MPFSHELRAKLLSALTHEQLYEGMHVVTPTGEIHTGPEASTRLLDTIMPRLRRFLGADMAGSSAQALVRRGYAAVSENRARLARFVPNTEPVCRIHD